MKRKPQRPDRSGGDDGIRVLGDERRGPHGSVPLVAILLTVAVAAFLLLRRSDPPVHIVAPEPRALVAGSPTRAGRPVPVVDEVEERTKPRSLPARRRATGGRRPEAGNSSLEGSRAGDADETGREIDVRDYIAALRESGETGGIAAFSPPGTRPPRSGVVVPAEYDLPEGFARHYQTTDDGRQLAPVLVLAPGYEIVDDTGAAVALTDGHIVPPEYAPPDLPVQMLDVPSEHATGEDAR